MVNVKEWTDNVNAIFISGGITGVDGYEDIFDAAEIELRSLYPDWLVINPAKMNGVLPKETAYRQYLKVSFSLLSGCKRIFMLHGWQGSNGAHAEHEYAKENDIEIIYEDDMPQKQTYSIPVRFTNTCNLGKKLSEDWIYIDVEARSYAIAIKQAEMWCERSNHTMVGAYCGVDVEKLQGNADE